MDGKRRHLTKRDVVYDDLRSSIMQGALAPGTRIIIDDVARRMGISQIPVREAIQQLVSERLVDNVPHIGATVARLSPTDIQEVFALMEGLESVAVAVSVERAAPRFVGDLERIVKQMDAALAADDRDDWASLNSEFHRRIALETGMPLLIDMMNRTLDQWDRVRRYFNMLSRRATRAQAQHREILEAFRASDVPALQQLMRDHNREPMVAYTEQLADERRGLADAVVAG